MEMNSPEHWYVIEMSEDDDEQLLALPSSWLAKEPEDYDAEGPFTEDEAKDLADSFLELGMYADWKDYSIDDLHWSVNSLYTLVDEGYVDGLASLLAFRDPED